MPRTEVEPTVDTDPALLAGAATAELPEASARHETDGSTHPSGRARAHAESHGDDRAPRRTPKR